MDELVTATPAVDGPSYVVDNENYSVNYLKDFFSRMPLEEKIKVKNAGRPTPLVNIVQVSKGQKRDFKRVFKRELYEKHEWLCGCNIKNSLFCFPCLLFAPHTAEDAWVKSGVVDLAHLSQKIKKHETSQVHINSQLDLKLLGKTNIRQQLDSAYRRNIEKQNEKVLQNRYVLSKIINCIKFCGIFELALRGHDERDNSQNPGIFKGLINFSSELDTVLREHFQKATVFKGTSKVIQNELLDCMLKVCQEHIKKEIADAPFLAVIADETTDVSAKFQMVVVFRYILKDGTPVERFWVFLNPEGHSAVNLANSINENLKQVLDNPDKLISQSYDGANVMSGRHGGVNKIIQDSYRYAYYVHCYAHQLNLILANATSQNTEVRIFFSNITDITNFFSNSPQRVAILDEIVGHAIPRTSNTRWMFKIRAVNTIYEHRSSLIECMEKIETTSNQTTAINQASAIRRMLYDSKFVFWLTFFHRVMPHADILYNKLQKTTTDPTEIVKAIEIFEKCMQKERETAENIPELISDVVHFQDKRRKEDPYLSKVVSAKEVCDCILTQIKDRFSFTSHLSSSLLFISDNFAQYEKRFPTEYLYDTIHAYPFLDKNRLQTELEIIYKRPDFRNLSGAIHCLKFIIENKLQDVFSATYTLLHIIITTPMTTAEAERNFSTLKRIKTFLRSTMNEERLSALAMLSSEKTMIQSIANFNELVVDKFSTLKDRRMDFSFKHTV